MEISKLTAFENDLKTDDWKHCIQKMFEHTGEDGMLYFPEWYYDNEFSDGKDKYFACKMNWNKSDCENLDREFKNLYAAVSGIAKDGNCDEDERCIINTSRLSDKQMQIYDKYLRPIDTSEFDDIRLYGSDGMGWSNDCIVKKHYAVQAAREYEERLRNSEELEEEDREEYESVKDITISDEEEAYYERYVNTKIKEAEKRIGKGIAVLDVITRGMRACALMVMKAPKAAVVNEVTTWAQAFAVHRYCTEMEIKYTVERFKEYESGIVG